MIIVVAAVAKNGVIGHNNRLPWDLPEERAHFVRITAGQTVLMGRKTFESIGGPLPGRQNIVVSRTLPKDTPGIKVFRSLLGFVSRPRYHTGKEVYVIGGASVYAQALPRADRLIISRLHQEYAGDAYLPPIRPRRWKIIQTQYFNNFTVETYEKIKIKKRQNSRQIY